MAFFKENKCFLIWLSAVCLSVVFRLVIMLKLTEYDTGFIKSSAFGITVTLFVVFLLIVVFAASFISASAVEAKKTQKHFLITSLFSFALGVSTAVSCVLDNYSGVPAFLRILCVCFGVLSAVFFIAFALRPFIHFSFSPMFTAIPLIFLIVKSAVIFIKCSYHTLINDTLFDVGAYCLSMLLFLEIARSTNNGGDKNSIKKFSAFCTSASIFLFCASVPKILLAVFNSSALNIGIGDSVFLLFLGAFTSSLLFARVNFAKEGRHRSGVYYTGKH